jgi:DNA repair photolyase
MSDPYNPFEKEQKLTRGALELIDRYGFGVVIDTKSDLVVRDIDILTRIKKHSPAVVNMTVTTADDYLCRKIEQNVCLSSARFAALKKLSDAGITCGVLLMPILPLINDTEENIINILYKAAESGVKWVYDGERFGVTLRMNQREHFFKKLDELFPGIKQKYIKQFGNSYGCVSPNNMELWKVFEAECRERKILYSMNDIIKYIKQDYDDAQMSLL